MFAALLAMASGGCSSTPPLDAYLRGWESEQDAQTHTFAHESFALNRRSGAEAEKLARSGDLRWSHYAAPLLAAATQSRSVHQAEGRSLVFERFLAHMRADPDVHSTEAWFADQVQATEAEAGTVGAQAAALVGAFAGPLPISEETFLRTSTAAARQGRTRGEALQLADLRRTAGNYFRRLGYDKSTLAFENADGSTVPPNGQLTASVESRLGWAELRQAILKPRACTPVGRVVTCDPAPPGSAAPIVAEEEPVAPPAVRGSALPGASIRWYEQGVRAPDLLKRRPGW